MYLGIIWFIVAAKLANCAYLGYNDPSSDEREFLADLENLVYQSDVSINL